MSFIDNLKAKWAEETGDMETDEKALTAVVGFALTIGAIIVALVVLAFVWALVKALFIPLVAVALVYLAGARFKGWPLPAALAKVVKK